MEYDNRYTDNGSRRDSWSPAIDDWLLDESRYPDDSVSNGWTPPREKWSGHFDVRQELDTWPTPKGWNANDKLPPSTIGGRNSPHGSILRRLSEYKEQYPLSNRWNPHRGDPPSDMGDNDAFIAKSRRRRPRAQHQRNEFDQLYRFWDDDSRLAPVGRNSISSNSFDDPDPAERWHVNGGNKFPSYEYESRDMDSYHNWSGNRKSGQQGSIDIWSGDPNNPYRKQEPSSYQPESPNGWMRRGDRWVREIKGSRPARDHYDNAYDTMSRGGHTWAGSTITSDTRDPFGPLPRRKTGPPSETSTLTSSSKRGFRLFRSGFSSGSSKGSRFSRSSKPSLGTMDRISVLTEDRSAEVAANNLVDDLRTKGFQLRGDGTILSTGSSACRKGDRYAKDGSDPDALEEYNQLRGSKSLDEDERYKVQPRDTKPEQSTTMDTFGRYGSSLGGSTRDEDTRLSPILMNSLIDDAQSSTEGSRTYDNSTISTRDTKSTQKKIDISISKLKNERDDDGTKTTNSDDNSVTISTVTSTLASTKRLTWGGEMPPPTSSGSRVPETVSKDLKYALRNDFSDLSSGPNTSIAQSIQQEDPMGRIMERVLLAIRMSIIQPCGKD